MDRKKFIIKSILGAAAVGATPLLVKGLSSDKQSTYDKLKEQVGFNHLPNNEEKTMKTVLHKAGTRGYANHGWLDTHHTFSFANYYNPERMHFGVLRVLNDDIVDGGKGFSTHPHDNMEIISVPIKGELEHKDSMGNVHVIKQGDIQVMSAGKGIYHSEFNKSQNDKTNFLQIWVFPNKKNVEPRYDQITLKTTDQKNKLQQILSPNPDDDGVWIHQNAWFYMAEMDKDKEIEHQLNKSENGIYAFVIEGNVEIEGQKLEKRDGFGIWDTTKIKIKSTSEAKVLLMEVPMSI